MIQLFMSCLIEHQRRSLQQHLIVQSLCAMREIDAFRLFLTRVEKLAALYLDPNK
jgi:hypothetical protein